MQSDIPRRLQGALLRIRGDHPFFGTLALFAEMRMTDDVPTAATDGKVVWFNPGFVEQQDPPRLCGLVAHELLHAALLHGVRRRERDPRLWNIAADIVVNGMIRKDTAYALPEGGVEDTSLAHLSVEEIYEQLQAGRIRVPTITLLDLQVSFGGSGSGNDSGGSKSGHELRGSKSGRDSDGAAGESESSGHSAMDEARAAELQRHWRSALQQAGAVARRMGRGIGKHGLDSVRDIGEATTPTLNWREILWQFMVATPYDFGGFDRRFIHRRLYLEETVGDSVDVAIVIDTSGSIGGPLLDAFLGEVQGILDAYPQIRGQLFFADAALYGPHEFERSTPIPPPRGGGGTSFVPFFNWLRRESDRAMPPLAIYFTDGYGEFPKTVPDAPVLWVVMEGGLETGGFPFGQVARMG